MKVGETHATGSQLVEDGGLDGTAVAADVAVAQIVSQQHDDVRAFSGGVAGGSRRDFRYVGRSNLLTRSATDSCLRAGGAAGGNCLSSTASDVGENLDERGSRIGHVRIEAAFFFPELADPGTLFGFEPGHDAIDVRLVAASVIAFGKRILVDASEELRGIGVGCSGGGPIRCIFLRLFRGGQFLGCEPFRGVGHDALVDGSGLFFHSSDEFGALFRNVVLLTDILREVMQLETANATLFEFGDPGLIEVVQVAVLMLQSIGLGIGESPVEQARAEIHSAQLFLEIVAEDLLDLLHESIGGF